MKNLIFSLAVLFAVPAFASGESVTGDEITRNFQGVLQGQTSAVGQLIDGSQCSVSLQVGAGRSQGLDTITVNGGGPLPVNLAKTATYARTAEKSREGYTTEIYSISFGDAVQQLRLTKVIPGLFIVRAKIEFRGQFADSADCFVKL